MQDKYKSHVGWATVVALLIIGASLWLLSKPASFTFSESPWRYLGQLSGIMGTILLSVEYLLSTRGRVFEKAFGGLDRTYIAHRLLGGVGFVLIIYHPFFLALNSEILLSGLKLYFLPGGIISYNFGIFALYAYAALIFLTVYVRLPYETWRKTHIYMGLPLFIAAYHIMVIGSDIENYLPLKIFIFSLVLIAIIAYIYKRFLYGKFSRQYIYKIKQVNVIDKIIELYLEPSDKQIQFIPGQFVFVKFYSENIPSELHPYSISSAPNEKDLRLSIKKLGDFTNRLNNLKTGDTVKLYGPHGEFGQKSLESNKPEIWIAGGIGITPFLSMLRYYATNHSVKNITFIYCAGNQSEFTYRTEIDSLTPNTSGLKVNYFASDEKGHINGKQVEIISGGLQGKKIFMCGPKPMMESLANDFESQKIHPRNIIFEDFSFLE